ncbi:hypothetical protein SLEP1_g58052 [Rubroshorea leprosula]|uniref:Uncharacterized protein n=1 Tax=Rubroshorea leprosula TaxID=152421 RepID=A0AAV5MPB3_9ROSI|nr:hypothetical protein SLEP1_g58052 [Rubroshorea leprosula]
MIGAGIQYISVFIKAGKSLSSKFSLFFTLITFSSGCFVLTYFVSFLFLTYFIILLVPLPGKHLQECM